MAPQGISYNVEIMFVYVNARTQSPCATAAHTALARPFSRAVGCLSLRQAIVANTGASRVHCCHQSRGGCFPASLHVAPCLGEALPACAGPLCVLYSVHMAATCPYLRSRFLCRYNDLRNIDKIAKVKGQVDELAGRGADPTKLSNAECVHALKGLALPRVSHSGGIALAGSRHLRSMFVAAPVLFVHAVVPVAQTK